MGVRVRAGCLCRWTYRGRRCDVNYQTIDEIINDAEFVKAPEGETCCKEGCNEKAVGELEWWNVGDVYDFNASTFFCAKHLIEKYVNS